MMQYLIERPDGSNDIVMADYHTLQDGNVIFKNHRIASYPQVVKIYARGSWVTIVVVSE